MSSSSAVSRGLAESDEHALRKISEVVSRITGIQLGAKQEGMVRSRLVKRLLELRIPDYETYHRYFLAHQKEETAFLVSLLTTHHTFFFREFHQFEYLLKGELKRIAKDAQKRDGVLKVWSAACSRGPEVYTLAMFLDLHLPELVPGLDFRILGTDVDPQSVAYAQNGVYPWENLKEVPHMYWNEHWARGKGEISEFVKARESLRKHCQFKTGNLLNMEPITEKFDLIFCRNVFIYFDALTITKVSRELMKRLEPHGLLFVGLSETLSGLDVPVESLGLSAYSHAKSSEETRTGKNSALALVYPNPAPISASPTRVLCVDDSPSILRLMAEMLTPENGFEIVATAKNGIEAGERVRQGGIDVVTLDIHMPEMDGIEYLKKHMKPGHPPVIMVTSVAREDQTLAMAALSAGAVDFVEKPSLSDLAAKGSELRTKLKAALRQAEGSRPSLALDSQFARPNSSPDLEKTAQIILMHASDAERLADFLRDLFQGPATLVLLADEKDRTDETMATIRRLGLKSQRLTSSQRTLATDLVTVAHLGRDDLYARSLISGKKSVLLVVGEKTAGSMEIMRSWDFYYVLLEDGTNTVWNSSHDRMPLTSFAYMSARKLGGR